MNSDCIEGMNFYLYDRYRAIKSDIQNLMLRTSRIAKKYFNLNVYSENQALHDFRFRLNDRAHVSSMLLLTNGRTKRNQYVCILVTSCCVILKRVGCTFLWVDLEEKFGMHSSVRSEVFR